MDNKITTERLKHTLHYDWIKFVAVLIVAFAVSFFIFGWIGTIKKWEKIEVFIICDEHYDDTLEEDSLKYLQENVPNNMVLQVNVTYISPSDLAYRQLYANNGGANSTLLIVPEYEMAYTGYKFPYLADKSYSRENVGSSGTVKPIYDCLTYFGEEILPKTDPINPQNNARLEQIRNYYVGNADEPSSDWGGKVFIYDPAEGEDAYEPARGNVYGLRIDNLPGVRTNYKFYRYEDTENGVQVAYQKLPDGSFVLDGNGNKVPYQDKAYLVINDVGYTVGKEGMKKKYYEHTETFELAKFILDRYFS